MLGREKGEELACACILSLALSLLLLETGGARLVSLLLLTLVFMRGTHHSARTCWFMGVMDCRVLVGDDAAVFPPGRPLVFLMTGVCCSSVSIRNISVVGVAKTSGVAVVEADAE